MVTMVDNDGLRKKAGGSLIGSLVGTSDQVILNDNMVKT